MATITVTFHYDPRPGDYPDKVDVEEMVAHDVEALRAGDLHILDLDDIAYRTEITGDVDDK